jgi:hypothetical protein
VGPTLVTTHRTPPGRNDHHPPGARIREERRGGFQSALQRDGLHTSRVSVLPETDVARVQRWCRGRVPEHVRDEVRVEVDVAERHVTIVECRPPWRADMGVDWTRFPIARLRYVKTTGVWSLYWRDRNLRFHAYDRVASTASVEELLAEVDRDPTAIFWG